MKPFAFQRVEPRPSGTGAFWDYAAMLSRLQETAERSMRRARPGRPTAEHGEAEQRWDGEGGNPGKSSIF